MTRQGDAGASVGATAIVVLCPEVDDRIRRWHVHTQTPGLPAHVSLIFPFKPLEELTAEDLDRLTSVFADEVTLHVRFARTGRFPGVLYLEPEDDASFRRFTDDLVDLWPDYPPYGGAFDDSIPHLTVAYGLPDAAIEAIDRELSPHLPLETIVEEAWLMTFDGDEWTCEHRFAFQASR